VSRPTGGFDEYRPRLRVEGGIRAKTARGAIGQSWWSRRFLAVLESFALGTRLTRGRTYARAGQVLSLNIAPGAVTASVQGSRPEPYRVTIGLAPFPELGWARIEIILAEQALYSARLLAGELPPDLEEVFAGAGFPLFPAAVHDLDMLCSCPDGAVPCKHLAATFYLLAEAFDADPFQILHWRGRPREALLDRLRILRTGLDPADDDPFSDGVVLGVPPPVPAADRADRADRPIGAASALAELPHVALADTLDRFWVPPQPLPVRPPTVATRPDLLLRQLRTPPDTIGGEGLVDRLRAAYLRFAKTP
jgi:uncharacterized Zn finger protein